MWPVIIDKLNVVLSGAILHMSCQCKNYRQDWSKKLLSALSCRLVVTAGKDVDTIAYQRYSTLTFYYLSKNSNCHLLCTFISKRRGVWGTLNPWVGASILALPLGL